MLHLLALLALKGGATHAAVAHTALAHTAAAHTATAHTAAAHAAAAHTAVGHTAAAHTAAHHAVVAGVSLDAATVGAAAFIRLYGGQVNALTANGKEHLSPGELRKIRDSSYQKVRQAMRRAFTPAEEAELKLIYTRLGI